MSKMKQRKRLTALALVFLLVFLTGAAFAFVPGMLDIVGQVGIEEADYVIWSMAHAPAPGVLTTSITTWEHGDADDLDILAPRDATSVGGTVTDMTYFAHGSETELEGITLNDAEVVNTRGRERQRILWDVVFYEPDAEARLYIEAANLSELFYALISDVTVTVVVEAYTAISLSNADVEAMFTIDGSFALLQGQILPPNTGANNSRSTVEYVSIEWNGYIPSGFEPEYFWAYDENEVFIGTFIIEFDYEVDA
jgi:hypothetical protein